ncbi:hypothetical protein BLNAU_1859 [Blattamonas nauphoetae]|uniref:DDE-1 domain-containing protein n=1 Tax=Blattamonas nauphoetae TaxID=2049346 RepID=A0ABQ9YHU3_9EUKA|nr:hypothetical protein BLNAU_1859 [Blattamonas nauphoetae]
MDNCGSHLTASIAKLAVQFNIIILSLPPNPTNLTQPLDGSMIQMLKKEYGRLCTKRHPFSQEAHRQAIEASLPAEVTAAFNPALEKKVVRSSPRKVAQKKNEVKRMITVPVKKPTSKLASLRTSSRSDNGTKEIVG